MKKTTLAFGTKINCSFAALAAVLALTVWFGFHTAGSLSDSLENATGKTLQKIELAGSLDTAVSDMATSGRGVIMFAYAKDSNQGAGSKELFRKSSESFRKALAEIGPLLVTEEGKRLVAHLESGFAQWVPAYAEMEQLADAGNPDGAVKVLVEKIKPQYLTLDADSEQLISVKKTLVEEIASRRAIRSLLPDG
jgi:hypothetical protein